MSAETIAVPSDAELALDLANDRAKQAEEILRMAELKAQDIRAAAMNYKDKLTAEGAKLLTSARKDAIKIGQDAQQQRAELRKQEADLRERETEFGVIKRQFEGDKEALRAATGNLFELCKTTLEKWKK